MKPLKLLQVISMSVCFSILLMGCGADDETQVYALPCLTPSEAQKYIWLEQRQQELADMLNAGDSRPAVWAEAERVAPQIGYLINASNIRSSASGCRYDWY